MGSLPEGYVPLSRRLPPGKPARTDAQKQADHWREHNQSLAEKNAARGKELREKNGAIPSLNSLYNRESDKAQQAARQAEIDASPHSFVNRIPSSMLPPSDPIVQEFKRKHFGQPTHEQEMESLRAERDVYRDGFNRLEKAIEGA
jgi:hypothetical protein